MAGYSMGVRQADQRSLLLRSRADQESATAEALRTIVELDLAERQTIEPPRGFGCD
jgi:hypothetical protein